MHHATLAAPQWNKDKRKLYFSYGSNLCLKAMRRRCPAAKPLYPLILDDAALVFRGVADVVYRRHGICAGGVWSITPECEQALDRYEGVNGQTGLYVKRHFDLRMRKSGLVRPVLFYKMTEHGICPPNSAYLQTIEQGYRDFGLDPGHLEAALAESWEESRITKRIARRYQRTGRPQLAERGLRIGMA